MRKFNVILIATVLIFMLAGCGDTLKDIKDAATGINSAADQAASAISQDVHSIRSIEITYNDQAFTVNDLFKSILRDVQWHYEKNNSSNILKVTGTWKPSLFEHYSSHNVSDKDLEKDGLVTVFLTVENHVILEDQTKVALVYKDQVLVNQKGKDVLYHLYESYTD